MIVSSRPQTNLTLLPLEVLHNVYAFCPLTQVLKTRLVCRQLNESVQNLFPPLCFTRIHQEGESRKILEKALKKLYSKINELPFQKRTAQKTFMKSQNIDYMIHLNGKDKNAARRTTYLTKQMSLCLFFPPALIFRNQSEDTKRLWNSLYHQWKNSQTFKELENKGDRLTFEIDKVNDCITTSRDKIIQLKLMVLATWLKFLLNSRPATGSPSTLLKKCSEPGLYCSITIKRENLKKPCKKTIRYRAVERSYDSLNPEIVSVKKSGHKGGFSRSLPISKKLFHSLFDCLQSSETKVSWTVISDPRSSHSETKPCVKKGSAS